MTTQLAPAPDTTARRDHIYPTLTAAQLARIAVHGRRRQVEEGEVLVPFVSAIVTSVSLADQTIEIDPPEGLLELD